MDKVLSGSGVTKVSKNGIEPSGHVSSTVNLMDWSMLLMCLRKLSLCSVCCTMKVWSTYLLHALGRFSTVLRALQNVPCTYKMGLNGNIAMIGLNGNLAMIGLNGNLMAASFTVHRCRSWSCSNLFCTMLRVVATDTEVNKAVTSY